MSIRCELLRTLPTWTPSWKVRAVCQHGISGQCSKSFLEPGDTLGGSPLCGIMGCWRGHWSRKRRWVRVFGLGGSIQEDVAVGSSRCQGMRRAGEGRWRHREGTCARLQPCERGDHTGPHLSRLLWVLCLAWTAKLLLGVCVSRFPGLTSCPTWDPVGAEPLGPGLCCSSPRDLKVCSLNSRPEPTLGPTNLPPQHVDAASLALLCCEVSRGDAGYRKTCPWGKHPVSWATLGGASFSRRRPALSVTPCTMSGLCALMGSRPPLSSFLSSGRFRTLSR